MTKSNLPAKQLSDLPDTTANSQNLGTVIPRLQFKGDEGKYKTNLGDSFDGIEVIILGVKDSYVYFDKPFKAGQESDPACRSSDGKISENGEICGVCEKKNWGKNNEKPLCSACVDLLVLMGDKPYMLPFKKTALAPLKKYMAKLRIEDKRSYSQITKMGAVPKANYFLPTFEVGEEFDTKKATEYYNVYAKHVGTFNALAPETVEEKKTPSAEGKDPFGDEQFDDEIPE